MQDYQALSQILWTDDKWYTYEVLVNNSEYIVHYISYTLKKGYAEIKCITFNQVF